jgi:hypothetical protein
VINVQVAGPLGIQGWSCWGEKVGRGSRVQDTKEVGGSGLEELLVRHLGAEGSTGSQGPAHKFLGHMPGEGATCLQVLGPQGQSICRGRGWKGSAWSLPLSGLSLCYQEPEFPAYGDLPTRKGSVVLVWVVVMLLNSPCSGCWKSPEWLPSCGKGPGVGRQPIEMVPGEGMAC